MVRGRVAAALLLAAGAAHAGDIYVCKGEHGEKVYQNAPCPSAAEQVGHNQYSDAMARAPAPPPEAYRADPPPPPVSAPAGRLATSSDQGSHGLDSSVYQRGEVRALKCVTASGRVYYARGACGSSTTAVGTQPEAWRGDKVEGIPGAVMVSPNEALDPATGRIVQLVGAPPNRPVIARQQDQGTAVDPDEACRAARKAADGKFSQRLDRRARELCDEGRSLYDETPDGGIP